MATPSSPDGVFEFWRLRRSPEASDQPRLGALGELSFTTGTLMQLLWSKHMLDQMDRTLEFPVFGNEVAVPKIFSNREIQSVKVVLGEVMVETDVDVRELEPHIAIYVQAKDDTLVIQRSLDPNTDPEDIVDFIQGKPIGGNEPPTYKPLAKPISRPEINNLLVSLFASNHASQSVFQDIDFLQPHNFIQLTDTLEDHAFKKGVSGIYSFNDGNAEIEFSQSDDFESYGITYVDTSASQPRTIAASAASDMSFDMNFIINNGAGDIRVVIPSIAEITLLKDVVFNEIERLNAQQADEASRLTQEVVEEEEIINEVNQRMTDATIARIEVDTFLEGIGLDQDGFDAPDSGA